MSNDLDSGADGKQNGGSGSQDDGGQEERRTNLIVNYLPRTMTREAIRELFSAIGEVQGCKLISHIAGACHENENDQHESAGHSLGYGFVNYYRPEDAEKAIKILTGLKLENKTIKVSYSRPRSDAIKMTNLYVAGLPKEMSEQDFETMFSAYGRIITARILCDNLSIRQYVKEGAENLPGLSKGVGFVRFDQRLDAERAIYELHGTIPNGCTAPIIVRFASNCRDNKETRQPRPAYLPPGSTPRLAPTNCYRDSPLAVDQSTNSMFPENATCQSGWSVFVFNLAPATQEVVLWQLFEPFGVVLSVDVIRDKKTNKCRGFGFVTMAHYNEAVNAIEALNGYTHANRELQVSFKTNKSETSDGYKDDEILNGLHLKRPRFTVAGIDSKSF